MSFPSRLHIAARGRRATAVIVALVAPAALASQVPDTSKAPAADTSIHVAFGGYVDGFVAYDFGRPRSIDRALTTQAVRHDEFNINLAYIDATLTGARVRGRVAAQVGTSVQANYAAEPRIGTSAAPT
ncbi:MAG: outer membrane beta-barrel protein [Gemmatimonadaceae bacterium]